MAKPDRSKTILITGAAGGLGSALAQQCAARGAQLVLLDRDRRGLDKVCRMVEDAGAPAPGYCDIDLCELTPDNCEELLNGIVESYGALHGLVHCAARFDGLQPLDQVAGDAWLGHLQVNLNAAWLLTVTALPELQGSGGMVVFPINEEAGQGDAYWGPYGASQGALRSMVSTLKEELEGTGCEVVLFNPGPMRTGIRAKAYHSEDPSTLPLPDFAAEKISTLLFQE